MQTMKFLFFAAAASALLAAQSKIEFNRDVRPILSDKCFACHGPDAKAKGVQLRLDLEEAVKGAAAKIVPRITQQNKFLRMPPESTGNTLSPAEIATLRAWVDQGTPWQKHWAFLPPVKQAGSIDTFVRARLEKGGLKASPEASRETLLRRATLDITGLPPTTEEIDRKETYEQSLDRLLASPRYGERMAARWLDAARYADTNGYQYDGERVMWRWRDYVIESFNKNKPYDQFVVEQIAGDMLPGATFEQKLATGFNRNHRGNTEDGIIAEEYAVEYVVDRVETTSAVFLGLTMGCARCHNHKYDPIPQLDYYRLSAVLQTALDPYDWVKPTERDLDVALPAEREEAEKHNAPIEAEISRLEALIQDSAHKADAEKHKKTVADLKKKLRTKPRVRATYDMGGDPSPVYLLRRGEAHQLGDPVDPGVPSILKFASLKPYSIEPAFHGTSGRRLALARWLVQPAHPLTARVFVNRLWKHHFGRGIVATVSNFGRTGSLPTHPELLDWLATEFVRSGWDVKAMHRLMMISTAYRQSSFAGDSSSDPDNLLLARMPVRRMDAEQLHDSVLLAVGRLSPTRFGAPVPVEVKPGGEVVEQASKDEWRRSIYLLQRRTTPVTLLEVFDLPAMSPNCNERAHSTVPTQALELRNSPVVIEHARYLAARLMDEFLQPRDRVRAAYSRVLSRLPSEAETSKALASLDTLAAHWRSHLNDQKSTAPYGSTAQWYATGDLVHALLNSAEFIYVD
jgi:cytochrome c553